MKSYIGKQAYTVASVIELFKKRRETYDIYIDEEAYQGKSTASTNDVVTSEQGNSTIQDLNSNKADPKQDMVLINKDLTT